MGKYKFHISLRINLSCADKFQFSLAYDGEFGFTATLTVNMESKNAGLYANLFYYNEQTKSISPAASVISFP